MSDLSDILVNLLEVDESVRELSSSGEVQSPTVQTNLERVSDHLARIVAELERYIHVDTVHQVDAGLVRDLRG